jgi:hypothetical protein
MISWDVRLLNFNSIVPDENCKVVLIQQANKLYIVNTSNVVHEVIYQNALRYIGTFTVQKGNVVVDLNIWV